MIYTLVINGSQDYISFDAITSFVESQSASVTSYPVELGFPVSDNMVINSPSFTLNGVLTQYNINDREVVLEDGKFVVVGEDTQIKTLPQIEQSIRRLITDKIPFSIIKSTDKLRPFDTIVDDSLKTCVVESMSFPYEAGQDGIVTVNMTIKQIFTATVKVESTPQATPELIAITKKATKQDVAASTVGATSTGATTAGDNNGIPATTPKDTPADSNIPRSIALPSLNDRVLNSIRNSVFESEKYLTALNKAIELNQQAGRGKYEVIQGKDGIYRVFETVFK